MEALESSCAGDIRANPAVDHATLSGGGPLFRPVGDTTLRGQEIDATRRWKRFSLLYSAFQVEAARRKEYEARKDLQARAFSIYNK